jgi:hypothetical protein
MKTLPTSLASKTSHNKVSLELVVGKQGFTFCDHSYKYANLAV